MPLNLEKKIPFRVSRLGGYIDWDDAVQIPNGLAIACQNMQFLAESVKVRWGLRVATVTVSAMGNSTGTDFLTVLGSNSGPAVQQAAGGGTRHASGTFIRRPPIPGPPGTTNGGGGDFSNAIGANVQVGIVFSDAGALFIELPAGTGNLFPLTSPRMAAALLAVLPTNSVMQTAKAYNRIYQAFTDLVTSTGPVLALDAATGCESPVGQNPIGAAWTADTFYQQGDIVTPSDDPSTWFRRLNTGYSGSIEPLWPTDLGFFTTGYVPHYATATDGTGDAAWQEWTAAFPTYLPAPPAPIIADDPGGGAIPAGKDVYVRLAYYNNIGGSLWSPSIAFLNTAANDKLLLTFANSDAGPPMPAWLMSVMTLGTKGKFNWPSFQPIKIYVAAVTHGAGAPTSYQFYGTASAADVPIPIGLIPSGGANVTSPIVPTAAICSEQFMGEAGIRQAILLRQDTMGDLSGVDPRAVIGVQFSGAINEGALINFEPSTLDIYATVNDITAFAVGQSVNVQGANLSTLCGMDAIGDQTITQIFPGISVGLNSDGTQLQTSVAQYPTGTIVYVVADAPSNRASVAGQVTIPAGPCPVAIVPPGVQEGPGYSYDIVALSVVGLGPSGPFNYLSTSTPANPFSTTVESETTDGLGNGQARVDNLSGLAPGDTVQVDGWTLLNRDLNGQRVIATIAALNNTVTFPDTFAAGTYQASSITMSVVQTLPTRAIPGTVGIQLQFDDTTLPNGVNVTGNLLFVALPPCVDLAYLPSVQRMAYVTDQQPTNAVFSEEDFMGEIDGLNDVLTIEASNGSRLAGVRELLNGMIIALKETGGYQIIPTADVPANWGVNRLWGIHGPQSGRNIATGRDGTTGMDYILFVDPESGLFKWPPTLGQGDELDWLSKELSGANNQDASRMATWDRVNRAAGAQIQVVVDDIAKEVKLAVPLDGATTPSHILTMSYFNGWQDPLIPTLNGEWIANRAGRRWNIDPIPTRCMAMVKRTLAVPVDQRVNYHQLLLGLTIPDGVLPVALQYMQPGAYDDLGAGYLALYRPSYAREPIGDRPSVGGRFMRFIGVTGTVLGAGRMKITTFTDDPNFLSDPKFEDLDVGPPEKPGSAPIVHFNRSVKGDKELLNCEFSNDGQPNNWFQLLDMQLWYVPLGWTK